MWNIILKWDHMRKQPKSFQWKWLRSFFLRSHLVALGKMNYRNAAVGGARCHLIVHSLSALSQVANGTQEDLAFLLTALDSSLCLFFMFRKTIEGS